MNCKEVENKLIFYIEGDLTQTTNKEVKNHLQNCAACQKLYAEMKADMDFLNNDKVQEHNPFFFTRLEEKIKTNKQKSQTKIKQIVLQTLAYAAAVIIAIFIGVSLGKSYSTPTEFASETKLETSEFQLFAESYSINMQAEETYELIITDNK